MYRYLYIYVYIYISAHTYNCEFLIPNTNTMEVHVILCTIPESKPVHCRYVGLRLPRLRSCRGIGSQQFEAVQASLQLHFYVHGE